MLVAIVVGLSTGSIYGLTAMGLVLTYRTTGIFNLAHGATGMLGTYVFWQLWQDWGLPLPVALVLSLGVAAPLIGAAVHLLMFRWVRHRPIAVSLVAGIALLIGLQGVATLVWGSVFKTLPSLFPTGTHAVTDAFNVSNLQLGTAAVTAVAAAILYWYLQRTKFGMRTRAVVDNSGLAEVVGENVERIQIASWMVASVVATLAGILISPFIQLSVTGLTLIVIQAMAAAVVGRLRSLPLTYAGGLTLGLLEALLARYLPSGPVAQGLKVSAAFILLYMVVVAGSFLFRAFDAASSADLKGVMLGQSIHPSRSGPIYATFVLLAALIPWLDSFQVFLLASALILSIGLQGLVLITGFGGQVVIAQAGLIGVGAIAFARMVGEFELPMLLAAPVAVAIAGLVGLLLALPALRIRGLPFALLTLAFGLFLDNFVFTTKAFSGGFAGFTISRPEVFGLQLGDREMLYVGMAVSLLAALAVRNLASGRTGRQLTASRNSEEAANTFGAEAARTKVILMTYASLFAGACGVLTAVQVQSVSAIQFNLNQSIILLAVVVLGGIGSPLGAIVGAVLLNFLPELLGLVSLENMQQLVFGLGTAGVLMAGRGGLADLASIGIARVATANGGTQLTLPRPSLMSGPRFGLRRQALLSRGG